ncbi:MAG: hypothetical protein WC538_15530 [Thermoanaerobaculia bacterium]|jgi:hypothetical protein
MRRTSDIAVGCLLLAPVGPVMPAQRVDAAMDRVESLEPGLTVPAVEISSRGESETACG